MHIILLPLDIIAANITVMCMLVLLVLCRCPYDKIMWFNWRVGPDVDYIERSI